MTQTKYILYPFLRAVRGNWRNSLFLECCSSSCIYRKEEACEGYLMIANADGTPLLMPVRYFRLLTGESVAADECSGVLTCRIFESVYSLYIEWHTISANSCPLRQLCMEDELKR